MEYAAQTLLVVVAVVGAFFLCVWLLRDAQLRGKPGFLVVLLVLTLNIPGLIIWILFRPEKHSYRPVKHRDSESDEPPNSD